MRLTFLGTRAYIDVKNRRHRRHSAALIEAAGQRIMLDCGADWRGELGRIAPDAIVLTHAHPDHAFGLADGAPCPVYATPDTWAHIDSFPVDKRQMIAPWNPFELLCIRFEAFPVEHSTRCPAVGFRIRTPDTAPIFYVPDVAYLPDREAALQGCSLYVGDGATLTRSLVRKRGDHLLGHAPVRQQLTWCEKEGVPEAVFTHCGSYVVEGDERHLGADLRRLAKQRKVTARFAHDGLSLELSRPSA